MKTKVQVRFLKMLSVLTTTALLITLLSMFPTQSVSASGVVGTITHPGFLPNALVLDESRNRLFVFDEATDTVFIYNATTLQEVGSVVTTLEDSFSMVVDESAGKLYVGYFGPGVDLTDGIAVINTATGVLIKYLSSGGYTHLVKDETLNVVYASSNNYGVRKIDVASDIPTAISGITANLYTGMAVNPVTHELFVSNWSQNNGDFFIVDPTTLAVTTIPDMNGLGVAVNWTENKAYVSYCQPAGLEAVCIYDRDTNTNNPVHTTNDSTAPMVFNPSVNRMYTNTEVNAIATTFNGSTDAFTNTELTGGLATVGVRHSTDNVYYVNVAGTYVMKGSTGEIVAEFPVGGSCSVCQGAVVINQTSGLVYVINDDSVGKVTVIQDGTFTLSCTVTPLVGAGTTPGALTSSDCHSPLQNEQSYWNPYFADRYSINATAGQQMSFVLDGGTASEYLYLLDPSENILIEASGDYFAPARIPSSDSFTFSVSGMYILEVTSLYSGQETGNPYDSEWPYTLTIAISPGLFNKNNPTNGATNQSTSPTLSWGSSSDANSYEYCYDTTNDNACSGWTSNYSSTSKALSGLSAGTTYYWHVRANNSGGTTYANGSSTAFWSFTTAVSLPGAFNKSAPSNGATNQSTSPTLSWGSSTGVTSYEYCYDTTNDNACSNWTSNGSSTSKALSGLSSGTTYYWQVRAINAGGTIYSNGSATAFWSFTVTRGGDTTGVFRPSNGLLYLKNSNTTGFADVAINYGTGGDYPVTGDWDGDGDATIGIYRNGSFYLRNSNTLGFADLVFAFGTPGDQPVAGDWDGDGTDTIGVYSPSTGQFLLRDDNSAGPADYSFYLGNVGDVGIAGDWTAKGFDTVGVFRPSNGIIFLKNTNQTGFADIALNYGLAGDQPVVGDWDGNGTDTIGVYRNAQFLLRNSNDNGFADLVFALGIPGDMPIAGNWDGLP